MGRQASAFGLAGGPLHVESLREPFGNATTEGFGIRWGTKAFSEATILGATVSDVRISP